MNNFATVLCRTEGSVKICSHGSVPHFLFAPMENLLSSCLHSFSIGARCVLGIIGIALNKSKSVTQDPGIEALSKIVSAQLVRCKTPPKIEIVLEAFPSIWLHLLLFI